MDGSARVPASGTPASLPRPPSVYPVGPLPPPTLWDPGRQPDVSVSQMAPLCHGAAHWGEAQGSQARPGTFAQEEVGPWRGSKGFTQRECAWSHGTVPSQTARVTNSVTHPGPQQNRNCARYPSKGKAQGICITESHRSFPPTRQRPQLRPRAGKGGGILLARLQDLSACLHSPGPTRRRSPLLLPQSLSVPAHDLWHYPFRSAERPPRSGLWLLG